MGNLGQVNEELMMSSETSHKHGGSSSPKEGKGKRLWKKSRVSEYLSSPNVKFRRVVFFPT